MTPRTLDLIVRQHLGDLVMQNAELLAKLEASEATRKELEQALAARQTSSGGS